MTDALVSVVVPTRDRRDRLVRTLRTALRQRDVEFEVVVVDDGSRDGTAAAVEALGDARVRCLRQPEPQGVARARNAGIAAARGALLAFLDDDDLWPPGKLARQLEDLGAHRKWSVCAAVTADERLRPLALHPAPDAATLAAELRARNAVPGGCSGVVADSALVRAAGGFDPSFAVLADWDLWIRLAARSPAATVAEPLTVSVRHPGSMSADAARSRAELARLASRHGLDGRWHDDVLAWLARTDAAAGARLAATRASAALAVRGRDWRRLAEAAAALGGPRASGALERARVRRWPAARRAQVDGLLRAVAGASGDGGDDQMRGSQAGRPRS